jgi:hypothetical protein
VTPILLGCQPVVVTQFLACLNIPYSHNPDGALGNDSFAVWIAGMVDVASLILQRLAIDVIALIKGKDVGIAPGESLGTFFLGNPGANVLNDPSTLLNVLGCEESLSSNPRRTNTYLNLHRGTFSFLASSMFSLRGRPLSPQAGHGVSCVPLAVTAHVGSLTPLVHNEHMDGHEKRLALDMGCLKDEIQTDGYPRPMVHSKPVEFASRMPP